MGTVIGLLFSSVKTILFRTWGPLVPVAVAAVFALAFAPELLVDLHQEILKLLGLGAALVLLVAVLFLGSLRMRPHRTVRLWRWWISSALAASIVLGVLAYFDRNLMGLETPETLGGLVGTRILGTAPPFDLLKAMLGALRLLVLLIAISFVLQPKHTYRAISRSIRGLAWVLRTGARMSERCIRWTLRKTHDLTSYTEMQYRSSPTPPAMTDTLDDQPLTEPVLEEEKLANGLYEEMTPQNHGLEMEQEEAGTPASIDNHARRAPKTVSTTRQPWKLPAMDLLEVGARPAMITEEHKKVALRIEESLQHHGVEVTVEQIRPGPTVTLYGLVPGWVTRPGSKRNRGGRANQGEGVIAAEAPEDRKTRVKVDSILAREKDLALALAAPSLRIQAPVPGESVVGIEVPNREPLLVTTRSVMESDSFQQLRNKQALSLALGQGSGGEPIVADLRELPHLLIAGATGSGKSVCINAILASLTSTTLPDQLRLLLIDPKRVELTPLNGLPHLIAPVIVDTDRVVPALKGIMREMFRRYRTFEKLGARNIEAYHRHSQREEAMPYLVVGIDELADLMMAAPYDIEQTICRLAQLGRATGIHLIVATQRPSVDVVTGLIKANFPSRIGFAVASQVDSRTILDGVGAERLLGKGDMLFLSSNSPKPQRVQGAYFSDRETQKLIEHWRSQNGPILPSFDLEPEPVDQPDDYIGEERQGSSDVLLGKAKELASRYTHLSTSLLQRRLRIGYPRAARLMDILEDNGVVAPGEPGKSREVVATKSRGDS